MRCLIKLNKIKIYRIIVAIVFIVLISGASFFNIFKCEKIFAITNYTSSDFQSTKMYTALIHLYQKVKGGNYYPNFNENTFNSEEFKIIDLSNEGLLITSDLRKFNFGFATTLNLSNNSLTVFEETDLSGFSIEKLKNLNISNNKLTNVEISNFYNISNINLSNNNLKKLNIENTINGGDLEEGSIPVVVNLIANSVSRISNIKFSKSTRLNIELYLIGNLVLDYSTFSNNGVKVFLGIQNIPNNKKIDTTTEVEYFKLNQDNLYIEILDNIERVVLTEKQINDSEVEDSTCFSLPVGEYKITYKFAEMDEFTEIQESLKNYSFILFVNPTTPTYIVEINGKIKDELKRFQGTGKLYLSSEDNTTIYYKYSYTNEWVEGNEVELDRGGKYSVYIKCVAGEFYESAVTTIHINSSLNKILPDWLLLVIIVGITLAFFLLLLPFLGKKFVRN